MIILYAYLLAGFFFWLGAATVNIEMFRKKSAAAVLRGMGAIPLWPLLVIVAVVLYRMGKKV